MIRSFFGLDRNPFPQDSLSLLPRQQEVFDALRVHAQQGGLCLVLGEPGTGKSVLKETFRLHDSKRVIAPVVNRTLHSYFSVLRILCEAFQIDSHGQCFRCERRLVDEAFRLNSLGRMLVPFIDDAHLMDIDALRKLRLLFEDFPKNHNLVLIGQPSLLSTLSLSVNDDIKSRVTYSAIMPKLAPDDMERFIFSQLDLAGLGHNTFSEDALALIVRSSAGVIRQARNLCLASLVEAVRDRVKTVGLKQVNSMLLQPHWRKDYVLE